MGDYVMYQNFGTPGVWYELYADDPSVFKTPAVIYDVEAVRPEEVDLSELNLVEQGAVGR